MGVSHLPLDLGSRHQGRHRVDHDHVESTGPDEHVGYLECLLPGVGLRDEELVHVHTQSLGVHRIEGVLGIDERPHPAVALRLGNDVQRQRGLPAALGPEDLHDAAARHASDPERQVE